MAIDTTTFESRLQAKFDSTTDPKEMLLLGKALESTVGSIAVSNVQSEGDTQVARVIASMTGALPDQSGQAGKVLTSDGTNSSWQEGLPSQSNQSGKFLTTNGTSANWQALSSSALSADFEVEVGKTVSAGDVVNYANGKIGDNPVVNTQTALQTDSTYRYTTLNGSGTIALVVDSSGSDHGVRTGIVQTDGSINWNLRTTIYNGYSSSGNEIISLGGDRFAMTGGQTEGNWNCSNNWTAYAYFVFFSVNPTTGSISKSNAWTISHSSDVVSYAYFSAYPLAGNRIVVDARRAGYSGCSGSPGGHTYYYADFTTSGNISTTTTNSFSELTEYSTRNNVIKTFSSNSILMDVQGTEMRKSDWDGTYCTNSERIPLDSSYASGGFYYKPDNSIDSFVYAFINTANQLKLNTYSYSSGTITKTNDYTVIDSAAGVSLGSLTGTGNTILLGYENDSKGYVEFFTLDSTTKAVVGKGITLRHNSANEPVLLYGPNNSNKYTAVYNSSDNKIVSNVITVLSYNTTALNWIGIAQDNGNPGDTVSVVLDGVSGHLSGLTPGADYYYATSLYDGSVTSTPTEFLIGKALSTTEIKING